MQYSLNKDHQSASQMIAAKVKDIISRLPGCAGQAGDAVSAVTKVNMEDAPTLLKIHNRNESRISAVELKNQNSENHCISLKDNTLQVHFRSVNLYNEYPYRSESE